MSLVDEQAAFLLDVCKLIERVTALGWQVTGGELYRPREMQQLYFDRKLTKTMDSSHMKRLAIDLQFFFNGAWVQEKKLLQPIGDIWESLHPKNRWGGNWKSLIDTPHFERLV